MPCLRFNIALTLTVGVAKLVPETGEVADDRLAVPEYALEDFLIVLGRNEIIAALKDRVMEPLV